MSMYARNELENHSVIGKLLKIYYSYNLRGESFCNP